MNETGLLSSQIVVVATPRIERHPHTIPEGSSLALCVVCEAFVRGGSPRTAEKVYFHPTLGPVSLPGLWFPLVTSPQGPTGLFESYSKAESALAQAQMRIQLTCAA